MLVLSRDVGEQIVIDAAICVTVVAIRRNKVRLGVTAPGSVRVDRAARPLDLKCSDSSAFMRRDSLMRIACETTRALCETPIRLRQRN
jgi:carbon storage regulator CsrA